MYLCPWCEASYSAELVDAEYTFADGFAPRCPKGHVLRDSMTQLWLRNRPRWLVFVYGLAIGAALFAMAPQSVQVFFVFLGFLEPETLSKVRMIWAFGVMLCLLAFPILIFRKGLRNCSENGIRATHGLQRISFAGGFLVGVVLLPVTGYFLDILSATR